MSGEYTLILVIGVVASVVGMLIVRRLIPPEKLSENNEYVSFTFSMLSLIYGIYLAFTVVVVWQQFEEAEATVDQEVTLLASVFRSVEAFTPEERLQFRRDLLDYARSVIADDYPQMATGMKSSINPIYEKIWADFFKINLEGAGTRAELGYQETFSRLNDFAIARRQRILSSNASLPQSMWILLIIGATGTIMFTWFYGTRYRSIQLAATAFLSAVIIYGVLLVAMLEFPFGGGVRVSDYPYRELIERFQVLIRS